MRLAPCHVLFQFYVANGKLSCQLYQRSADLFLGVPFNIASYALLTLMLAQVCGLQPGEFIHTFGDLHLYHNHRQQTQTQIARDLRPLPKLSFARPVADIDNFVFEDFIIGHYNPHPHCRAGGGMKISLIAAIAANGVIGAKLRRHKTDAVASAGGLRPLQKTDLEQSNHHGRKTLKQ